MCSKQSHNKKKKIFIEKKKIKDTSINAIQFVALWMTLKLKNGRVRYYQLLFIVKRNNNQMLRKANLPLVFTASCWTWPIFWNQPSQTAQANSKTHDDACWTDVSHNTVYDHSQMLSHNVDGDGPWQGTYLGEFCLTCIPRSSVASHFFNETSFFFKRNSSRSRPLTPRHSV